MLLFPPNLTYGYVTQLIWILNWHYIVVFVTVIWHIYVIQHVCKIHNSMVFRSSLVHSFQQWIGIYKFTRKNGLGGSPWLIITWKLRKNINKIVFENQSLLEEILVHMSFNYSFSNVYCNTLLL